jgi:hypothetical protein
MGESGRIKERVKTILRAAAVLVQESTLPNLDLNKFEEELHCVKSNLRKAASSVANRTPQPLGLLAMMKWVEAQLNKAEIDGAMRGASPKLRQACWPGVLRAAGEAIEVLEELLRLGGYSPLWMGAKTRIEECRDAWVEQALRDEQIAFGWRRH